MIELPTQSQQTTAPAEPLSLAVTAPAALERPWNVPLEPRRRRWRWVLLAALAVSGFAVAGWQWRAAVQRESQLRRELAVREQRQAEQTRLLRESLAALTRIAETQAQSLDVQAERLRNLESRSLAPRPAKLTAASAPAFTVADEKTEPAKRKNKFVGAITHPIVVESAVLASSLLVPPSLPMTLAQSRLGRSLTRRVLKKSDANKTVSRVATSVGDMPITKRRRR